MEQEINKEPERLIDKLNSEFYEIKQKMSELRKAGIDVKIAEFKSANIPSKIDMIKITKDNKDIEKIKNMIQEVRQELEEAEGQKEEENIDYSKSYDDYSNIEIIKRARELISDGRKNIEQKDYQGALDNYAELREIYNYLPMNLKRPIYKEIHDIYKRIINSGYIKIKEEEKKKELEKISKKKNIFGFFSSVFKKRSIT